MIRWRVEVRPPHNQPGHKQVADMQRPLASFNHLIINVIGWQPMLHVHAENAGFGTA
jgi:hypothetical protein